MPSNFYRSFLLLAGIVILTGSEMTACSPAKTAETGESQSEAQTKGTERVKVFTIGTADAGGTMAPAGQALASAFASADPDLKVNVSVSTGSEENLHSLQNQEIDLGLASGDMAWQAYNGQGNFDGHRYKDIRAIAALYSSTSDWMVPNDRGLIYVHDLEGKNCAIGPENSSTDRAARVGLTACGITIDPNRVKNISIGEGSKMCADGTIDAVHGFAGNPISGLSELANSTPSNLLRYTNGELTSILDQYEYYDAFTIPAGTYAGQNTDVETFGVKCLLCVDAAMEDEDAYELTKALDESTESLASAYPFLGELTKPGFTYTSLPVPLHSGAEKYYVDRGYLEAEKDSN